jgi:hypothetical protein
VPPETIILHIPDPDEPIQATETPQPAWFTVLNATSNTLTYLDIYTNDMLAVDDLGYNILPDRELVPGKTATILFSEHPDLAEAMLWRYGQVFHVFAEDESQSTYYREWYPDHESLELVISVEDRQGPQVGNLAEEGTIRIVNMTDYALVELYILTPEMEENLDFSIELLGHQALPGGLSVDLRADQVPYLADYLNGTEPDLSSGHRVRRG